MKLTVPFSLLAFAASLPLYAGLPSVGPDYVRPSTAAPAAYRDPSDAGAWKAAAPADTSPRGEWWKLFADPALDTLESRALTANQDLRAAAARVEQARHVRYAHRPIAHTAMRGLRLH